MRKLKLGSALALAAALVTVGCATPQPGVVPTTTPLGAVSYFDQVNGMAAVDIRVVDKRMGTQAFADVPAYHKVKFEIRNSSKLKNARTSGDLTPSGTGVYSQAFSSLPSDSSENYELSAALYGHPFAVAAPAPIEAKVGEGVSGKFSLLPGERKTITVVINAAGAFTFDSDYTQVEAVSIDPTFVAGDTSAKALITLDAEKNPLARSLRYYVARMVNGVPVMLGGPETIEMIPVEDWNSSRPTELPFALPALADPEQSETFALLIGMFGEDDEKPLSVRARQFVVEPGAEVNVDLKDPVTPMPNSLTITMSSGDMLVNGVAILDLSPDYYYLGAATSVSQQVTITNSTTTFLEIKSAVDTTTYGVGLLAPGDTQTITVPTNGTHLRLLFRLPIPG